MKRVIAFVLLIAIAVSLCACAGKSKIRTSWGAISAVKKDKDTELNIYRHLGFKSMDKIRFTSSSAEKTDGGWKVVLKGTATGVRANSSAMNGIWTYEFKYIATISYDGVINDYSVVITAGKL